MADPDRGKISALIQSLEEKPQGFSFFQALRLLKLATGKSALPEVTSFYDDNLRVRPHLTLSFPSSDMVEAAVVPSPDDDGFKVNITATFLGLYGTGSPLPTFYTEELLDELNDDKCVSRDFLDILGSRLFVHFARIWSKYRLMVKVLDEEDPEYLERLYCLMGLGHPELRVRLSRPMAALRYIGLFTQYPHCALGLKTMLADAVGSPAVTVHQCVQRWVDIPEDQRLVLGVQGCALGEDCWLGSQVADRMGKIAVEFSDLTSEQFHGLLPGRELNYHVESLVTMYLVDPVEHDLCLALRPGEVEPARLGGAQWANLGYDTWLFPRDHAGEARVSFPGSLAVPV